MMSAELKARVRAQHRCGCRCQPAGWGYYPFVGAATDPEVRFRGAVSFSLYFLLSALMQGDLLKGAASAIRIAEEILGEHSERLRFAKQSRVVNLAEFRRLRGLS